MKRVTPWGIGALLAAATLGSCTSVNDEIVDQPPKRPDAGSDTSSFGGTGGTGGSLGSGGTDIGGTGGSTSGSSGTGTGGTGGTGGTEPVDGAGGGTCAAEFCPIIGVGQPCCVVPGEGPCGVDNGFGCQSLPPNDF